jgi:hypothetical protein
MSEPLFQSSIWKSTLDVNSVFSSEHKNEVDLLRTVFLQARKNAAIIAENIKQSQPGLTIHDITHLDSLFETCDLILNEKDNRLNPVEAFVLGCSILFHDLGMALYVWEEEIYEIKKTPEFADLLFDFLYNKFERKPTSTELDNPSNEDLNIVLATIFRLHHAEKAKDLPKKSWKFNGQEIYIIDNFELREKLGEKIGTIAQSHWWSVETLRSYFKDTISPAPTGYPPLWKIDNIKISCLLRIADFINIDDRRAPTFQFALLRPGNYSQLSVLHWTFQNKMNRPIIKDGLIIYESKSPFIDIESDSWWLAYNTISDINKEIGFVNELLTDRCYTRLVCIGVKGAGNPMVFAESVKSEGWSPANTEFKISDLYNVINKLGGLQLYGERYEVPIKELIQNAVDAILAKKIFVPHFADEVIVNFYIDKYGDEWLEIKDNGIGMSMSKMLNYLLDFGKSYWASDLVRIEYPGLRSSNFKHTGNYGIGFFSIFMIAKEVTVISKPLNGGDTNILEFKNGIKSNPILKKSKDWFESGTVVKLKLSKTNYYINENFITTLLKKISFSIKINKEEDSLSILCKALAPAISGNMMSTYLHGSTKKVVNSYDWHELDEFELLKRIYGIDENGENRAGAVEYLKFIAQFIKPIVSIENGEIIARATIIRKDSQVTNLFKGVITVGGLTESSLMLLPGLWIGDNKRVTRDLAVPKCKYSDLLYWLEEQYNLLISFKHQFKQIELYEMASLFFSFGLECKDLPIANTVDGFLTFNDICQMDFGDHVLIRPVIKEYEPKLKTIPGLLYSKFSYFESTLNEFGRTEMLWTSEIEKKFSEIGLSPLVIHNPRSLFCFTILAIAKSWDVPFVDVIKYSFLSITKWQPIINVYQDEMGNYIEEPVLVVINPKLTTRKIIAKKYENEMKKWIGTADNVDFDISQFY